MAIIMRLLYLLLSSIFIFNVQAMHTTSAQVVQWTKKNKTPLVAGSIVAAGGVTAYYLESPKIFAGSVAVAGVYVACQSLCNDDEFEQRLKRISEQNKQIEEQRKKLGSGIDELFKEQKDVTKLAVQFSKNIQETDKLVNAMIEEVKSLDANFLQDAKNMPVVVEEMQRKFDNNVAMCNNIHVKAENVAKEVKAVGAALGDGNHISQEAQAFLCKHIDDGVERTSKLVAQGTTDILKLLGNYPAKETLSGSY